MSVRFIFWESERRRFPIDNLQLVLLPVWELYLDIYCLLDVLTNCIKIQWFCDFYVLDCFVQYILSIPHDLGNFCYWSGPKYCAHHFSCRLMKWCMLNFTFEYFRSALLYFVQECKFARRIKSRKMLLPHTLENTIMWTKDLDLVINFNWLLIVSIYEKVLWTVKQLFSINAERIAFFEEKPRKLKHGSFNSITEGYRPQIRLLTPGKAISKIVWNTSDIGMEVNKNILPLWFSF